MTHKEALDARLTEGYEALAGLELGSTEYKLASESLKALQEAYNGIERSENARHAVDARTAQTRDMTIADMKMRAFELGTRTVFNGIWNSKWLTLETDGVVKTLGARNRLNNIGKW